MLSPRENWIDCRCPVWGSPAKINSAKAGDSAEYYSARAGGQFILTGSVQSIEIEAARVALSNYIAKQNIAGLTPRITSYDIESIRDPATLRIAEIYNTFLGAVAHCYPRLGTSFRARDLWAGEQSWFIEAAIGSPVFLDGRSRQEVHILIETALANGHFARVDTSTNPYRISINGHEYLEDLGISLSESEQIFVAMWFGDLKVNKYYNTAVKPAIEAAGYIPMRIDDHQHNEKIDDQIIAEIRKSRALVCDITCGLSQPSGEWSSADLVGAPRGGVFYEAGFAQGLGLPVIWTVKQDIADVENVCHFDVRQFNQIRWGEDLVNAKKRIQNRIEATIGKNVR